MTIFRSDSELSPTSPANGDSSSLNEGDLESIQEEEEDETPLQMRALGSPGTVSRQFEREKKRESERERAKKDSKSVHLCVYFDTNRFSCSIS